MTVTAVAPPKAPSAPAQAAARVKRLALQAGFDLVGIAPVQPFERERQALEERIDGGLFDGLPWFTKERARVSSDPRSLLPDATSIIALGMSYGDGDGPAGVVARYAWGRDYHEVVRERTKQLITSLEAELGPFESRTFVDTGRLVDRAAAVRGGLGWYGKNTNILNSRLGSWLFLASIVTTLELQPDRPTRRNCGQCRTCIDACPTGAIVAPYVVDNDRCISFLTIELRGPIPHDLRPLMGSCIFGCDICQDVCPVNAQAQPAHHPEFAFRGGLPGVSELVELLRLTEDEFRARFRHSPIARAKRRGLLRNVAVALGNSGRPDAVPPLAAALADPEPLVRSHAAWALGRLGGAAALRALRDAEARETDPYVLEEIRLANSAQ